MQEYRWIVQCPSWLRSPSYHDFGICKNVQKLLLGLFILQTIPCNFFNLLSGLYCKHCEQYYLDFSWNPNILLLASIFTTHYTDGSISYKNNKCFCIFLIGYRRAVTSLLLCWTTKAPCKTHWVVCDKSFRKYRVLWYFCRVFVLVKR